MLRRFTDTLVIPYVCRIEPKVTQSIIDHNLIDTTKGECSVMFLACPRSQFKLLHSSYPAAFLFGNFFLKHNQLTVQMY